MKRKTNIACAFGAALAIGTLACPLALSRAVHAADLGLQDSNGIIRSDLLASRFEGALTERSDLKELAGLTGGLLQPNGILKDLSTILTPSTLGGALSLADTLETSLSIRTPATIWRLSNSLTDPNGLLLSQLALDGALSSTLSLETPARLAETPASIWLTDNILKSTLSLADSLAGPNGLILSQLALDGDLTSTLSLKTPSTLSLIHNLDSTGELSLADHLDSTLNLKRLSNLLLSRSSLSEILRLSEYLGGWQ